KWQIALMDKALVAIIFEHSGSFAAVRLAHNGFTALSAAYCSVCGTAVPLCQTLPSGKPPFTLSTKAFHALFVRTRTGR
ncbi:MAG: hypothetical protein KBH00_09230, partial [Acidovorax sp.]|nr:hypothetical protein [Acidovorax sp.]